jgi:hypothetical protein
LNDESASPSVGPGSSTEGTSGTGGGGAGADTACALCADGCSLGLDFAEEKEAVDLKRGWTLDWKARSRWLHLHLLVLTHQSPRQTAVAVAVAGLPSPHL